MPAMLRTTLFALLLLAPGFARAAVTETFTESPTGTPTVTLTSTATATPTPTPGSGSSSFLVYGPNALPLPTPFLVNGSNGNAMDVFYTTGEPWAPGGGLLTVVFPSAMGAPNGGNFWVAPGQSNRVLGYSFAGQSVSISLRDMGNAETISLRYGQNATGFSANGTPGVIQVKVYAYPQSLTLGTGGLASAIDLNLYTPTPTPTASPSFTITETFTVSPTLTVTATRTPTPDWTHTVTPTETPLGPAIANGVYAYPNPFNQRLTDKVTFRFPASASATLTVFNLVGEPVRVLESGDVQAGAGWAIWRGEDDYLRKVSGGLYFVRVVTPGGTYIKKFTVLY